MGTIIVVRELPVSVEQAADPEDRLRSLVARRLGASSETLGTLTVIRRALDARRGSPRYRFAVEVEVAEADARRWIEAGLAEPPRRPDRSQLRLARPPDGPPPVVVGAGPAGLFAALTLAEAGWPPIIVERGRKVGPRARDVSRLYAHGELNPESNVCYGEGGAGTFSDGKLYTRVNDPKVRRFLEQLVARGADPDILIANRPHLGTDRLVVILESVRTHLESLGVRFRFETRVEDFEVRDGAITGVTTNGGERIEASAVVSASGHSAREIWYRLAAHGIPLETRPFAVGFRVEHPQPLIDEIRYGRFAGHQDLPAADYRLTHNEAGGRSVYSFCMCPGGVVVTTPTQPDELCINGMSHASRSGRFANSALVVTVGPEDFAEAGFSGIFAGVDFQIAIERAAYAMGGGEFVAPAARLSDFAAAAATDRLGPTSYRRGIVPAPIDELYPAVVTDALRRALERFNHSMRGFVTEEATLIGVETRTASPIRVPRGDDRQALGCRGLYPVGEGMGYGGGIASAAIDGIASAEAILVAAGAER